MTTARRLLAAAHGGAHATLPAFVLGSISDNSVSVQTVVNDSTGNEFPGLARLDESRVLVVYRGNAADHHTDGQVCGQIGTLNATHDLVTSWTAKFTILDDTLDLRVEDGVSVVRDSDGFDKLVVAFRKFDGSDNHNPSLLICDVGPGSCTSSSTWTTVALPDPGGTVQEYTQGHVSKTAAGTFICGGGYDSGGDHTVGVWRWTASLSDPSAATFVVIGSGSGDFQEISVQPRADGTLLALLRRGASSATYYSTSSNDGVTWTAPALAHDGYGYPMWRELPSGLVLTVYRDSPNGDTMWRVSTNHGISYGSETLLDATGTRNAYATLLATTSNDILCVYGVEYSSDGSTGSADLFAQWFRDSSTFPTGVTDQFTGYNEAGGGGGVCLIGGTLQAAIDATASGGTLDASNCTFHESVTIDHPMTLTGGTIDAQNIRTKWVTVTGDDVTIDGLTATNCAAGSFQSAGIDVSGARFTGRNLTLDGGPYACLRLWITATDAQILDCDMQDGPTVGLLGFQADNTIVDGGRYHHSNGSTDVGNESGGMKFGESLNVTVRNLEADHNTGPGVWLDISCDGSTIDTVHAHENTRSGIHVEITDNVLVSGCTVHRNCTEDGTNAFVENGIFISSSRNVTVSGNTVAFNNASSPTSPAPIDIAFVSQNRSPLPHNGNSGTNNVLRSAVTAIAAYTDWADTGGSNTTSPNTLVSDSDPRISVL